MSEYQYYEFCGLYSPLTEKAVEELASLSSRAQITSHGVSYEYSYGDFRGNPKELVLKYFDIFFYIANWGNIQLMFKFKKDEVVLDKIEKYCIEDIIEYEEYGKNILLNIDLCKEGGGCWIEGKDLLRNLIPLHKEIINKDYTILELVSIIECEGSISEIKEGKLSKAQKSLLNIIELIEA